VFRKLVVGALILSGIVFIALGVQQWLDRRAASDVVAAFLTALKDGDREAALSQLLPEPRDIFERSIGKDDADFWTPDPEFGFRIQKIDIKDNQAVADVWIEKRGFVILPVFHLQRNESTRWKIALIENLYVDERWNDIQYERARQEGLDVKASLEEALEGQPGVTIERTPLGGANPGSGDASDDANSE